MKFSTQNSTYQVAIGQKLIRRLAGVNAPTSSQGEDGKWQEYQSLTNVAVGHRAVIYWRNKHIADAVMTSPIQSIAMDDGELNGNLMDTCDAPRVASC